MKEVNFEKLSLTYLKPSLIKDLGMVFATEGSKQKRRYGIYKCGFCGEEFRAQTLMVKNGNTKSCGCYKKQVITKHNLRGTKLYGIWANIKNRTLNSNCKDYNEYGGRGITICEEWKNDFMSFYTWAISNGYEENKGLSIDRIDNDGSYSPENCRWTTRTIQNRNQRTPKNNKSGYKGVSYHKRDGNYQAYININKKQKFLGYFTSPEEGAIAYNNYIIENNLEGYILNEIPEKL